MSVKINRIILNGNEKKYSLAIFMYVGNQDPKYVLDKAIATYVGEKEYYELVDDYLDNPWTRVIAEELYEEFKMDVKTIEGRKFNVYNLHSKTNIEVKYLTYVEGPDERPNPIMDIAKVEISNGKGYNSYIDSDISDLWSRLLIFGLNEIPQEVFKDQRL